MQTILLHLYISSVHNNSVQLRHLQMLQYLISLLTHQ
uniref:Uncharacterized protein n=1 Tax=virus sp. ctrcb4 TaxID=2825824 RepID=A0A8S5RQH4_9VIRU|nr:MAG TPA: hypothetical protein [virus sp. ctrcb4]